MRKDLSYLCLRIVGKCERIFISTKVIQPLEKTRAVVPPRSNPAAAIFTVVNHWSQYVTPCCDWGRVRGKKQLFGNAYWSFVRGIHRSSVDSPHIRSAMRIFGVFFLVGMNKGLNKQSSWKWLKTTWRSGEVTTMGILEIYLNYNSQHAMCSLSYLQSIDCHLISCLNIIDVHSLTGHNFWFYDEVPGKNVLPGTNLYHVDSYRHCIITQLFSEFR